MAAKPVHKANVIMACFDHCETVAGTQVGPSAIHLCQMTFCVSKAALSSRLRKFFRDLVAASYNSCSLSSMQAT